MPSLPYRIPSFTYQPIDVEETRAYFLVDLCQVSRVIRNIGLLLTSGFIWKKLDMFKGEETALS